METSPLPSTLTKGSLLWHQCPPSLREASLLFASELCPFIGRQPPWCREAAKQGTGTSRELPWLQFSIIIVISRSYIWLQVYKNIG